ncbi:Vacuolar protein sorting-associated protein Vps41 [Schizosaccharomyces pombe]
MSVDESNSDSEIDSISSSDEDEEPKLIYERITEKFQGCFMNDTISACAISKEHFFFGSHNGAIYIYQKNGILLRKMILHSASVVDLSVDLESENLASCSMDGKMIISNITTRETTVHDFKRPLLSVAIDPYYSTRSSRQVLSGGRAGKVVLSEKGWLGNKDTVLQADCGAVYKISWYTTYIAWASDLGITVYSTEFGKVLGRLEPPKRLPNDEIFPYQLFWQSESRLVIGWSDQIMIVSIQRSNVANELPKISLQALLEIDSIVSGVLMLGFNILTLAYIANVEDFTSAIPSQRIEGCRPELRLIDSSFKELCGDAIGLANYSRLQPSDYHLLPDPSSNSHSFVISPNDIVYVRERNQIDHVKYLVSKEMYAEAIDAVKKLPEIPPSLQISELAKKYIFHLLGKGQYKEAGMVIPSLYNDNLAEWEQWVFVFAENDHLEDIADFLPTGENHLSPLVYEMILAQYLATDERTFNKKLHEWPTMLYSVSTIRNATLKKFKENQKSSTLTESLAFLYLEDNMPIDAFHLYLKLHSELCIDLILQHNLYDEARASVLLLMLISSKGKSSDTKSAMSSMLVQHVHSFPPQEVIMQIHSVPQFLYEYFCEFELMYPNSLMEYGDLKLDVFAEFDRKRFFDFLVNTQCYSLDHAAQICKQYNYLDELVYILGRMGNNKEALMLIINELLDIGRAIRYVKEQADRELWDDLISYSLDKPEFICTLLENIGTDENARNLLSKIPPGTKLPHMKKSISKLLADHQSQVQLYQSCYKLFKNESISMAIKYREQEQSGLEFLVKDNPFNFFGDEQLDYNYRKRIPMIYDLRTKKYIRPEDVRIDTDDVFKDDKIAYFKTRMHLKPEVQMRNKLDLLMMLYKQT